MAANQARVVVQVISNLEYGGAQRQVVELTNGMDPQRFEMHVVSLSAYAPLADHLADRTRLHIFPKRRKYDLPLVGRLASLFRELDATVVHGYLFDAVIAARLAGRLAHTPLVISGERNADYRMKWAQRVACRLTRNCTDLIIANSHAGAAFHGRMHGHRPEQYRVVYNGVDTERFRPRAADEVRAELGIPKGAAVVGVFASFKEQKNHELFFVALRRLIDSGQQVRALLVGDELAGGMHGSNAYKARMMHRMDELGVSSACMCLGNRSDVERLYPVCDLTVLPSLFEGTPNVVLESLACGVPVVVTDVADNARIVPDGRVGFVVPLGRGDLLADRMRTLLRDAGLRTVAAIDARRWAEEHFSLAQLARRTADVYEEALFAQGSSRERKLGREPLIGPQFRSSGGKRALQASDTR